MTISPNTSRLARAAVACIATTVFVGACGDDSTDSQSTTAASATASAATPEATQGASTAVSTAGASSPGGSGDVCADREALRSSVDALTDVDVVAEGTNGVTAAIAGVKDDLTALRESAGAELRPDVQAVQDAVDELETTVGTGTIGSGSVVGTATALATVASAATALLDSLETAPCGSSTTPTT
jgi:hypothetical protein